MKENAKIVDKLGIMDQLNIEMLIRTKRRFTLATRPIDKWLSRKL